MRGILAGAFLACTSPGFNPTKKYGGTRLQSQLSGEGGSWLRSSKSL